MEPERWEQVRSVFESTADLPEGQKRGAVHRLCGEDRDLAESVLEMLQEDANPMSVLDEDVDQVLARMAAKALGSDHLPSLVQRQIGPYRLLRVLGEGGMGVVYLAERTDIGGQVAIKFLRQPWLSPMRRERFLLEQQALVKLNHPAIARIYDANTMEDGTPWFVMEYAEGLSFTDYTGQRGGAVREDLLLFRRVCEAVQYAHTLAIIHRDLKPSNILVTHAGQVKLLDFGIAKQLDLEASSAERTIAGLRLLTPSYAAPEQSEGRAVGVFTDVYSLGVLLYEILTGRLPRPATQADEAVVKPSAMARTQRATPSRTRLSKHEWADLDVLCLTALQAEPERRYRSVDSLIRDIDAYLDGRVLEAKPSSFACTAVKFVRRNRVVLSALTIAVVFVTVASIIFTVRLERARAAALAEAVRTQRIQHIMLDTLGSSDEEAGPSNELKVVDLLDREAQGVDTLHADPETQMELEQTLGSMYDRLGKYDKSEALLTRALNTSQAMGKGYALNAAAILVERGVLQGDRGNTKEGEADLERATRMAKQQPVPSADAVLAKAAVGLSRIAIQSGAYGKAIDLLTPVAEGRGGLYDIRDAVAALSVAQTGAHHYGLAETASRRALQMDEQLLGGNHVQTAVDLANLASAELSEGNMADAEQHYRQSSNIMQAWYGPDHPDVATTMGLLARALMANGKNAEAEGILTQVLRIQEKAYGSDHARVAATLVSLGTLSVNRGDLQPAEAYLSRAVEIFHATLGDDDPHTAAARSTLGTAYLKEHRYLLAESTLRQSVEVIAKLPSGNSLIGASRARWGRALLALHRYDEAEQQLIAGEELMRAQRTPPPLDVKNVQSDLVALSLVTHRPFQRSQHQDKPGSVQR